MFSERLYFRVTIYSTMKLYLSLLLTAFSLSSFSQLPDSLVTYYDTCTTNFHRHVFAQNISRANAWKDPRLSHAALFHAFEDIQKSNDSSEVSDIIMEHAILHAILRDWDSASVLFQRALV